MMNDKKTMGVAALAAMMAVVAVFGVVSCFDMASAEESKEYNIYIDLGGERASFMLYDGTAVDYGAPEWVTVMASSPENALKAACDVKFGEGSLVLTSTGYIKKINGMSGNGLVFFSDQAFTGEADQWGISYYPIQFVKEESGWEFATQAIAGYTGESTTFAVVCQPSSMDDEPVDFTFDEDAYAMSWDTYAMYYDGLEERYEVMADYYLWEYGTPSEPFFATTGIEITDDGVVGNGCSKSISNTISPSYATNKNLVWTSSDESVATVDENGVVTGVSVGSAVITAVTVDGWSDEIEVTVIEPLEYNIYIDLGGVISGVIMGTYADYGEPSWETVKAISAIDALTAACEQKFGEGSIVYKTSSWGTSIGTINGMSGNGISFRSNEAVSWDDVYYYPVQYIMEDGVWAEASVTIPNYTGDSTTFAIVAQPITFDSIVHTFDDEDIELTYNYMIYTFDWPGYGSFAEPFIATTGVDIVQESVTFSFGTQLDVVMTPENATNTKVLWVSADESVATVDSDGYVIAVAPGTTTITALSHYGMCLDYCEVEVVPAEYNIFIDLGGDVSGFFLGTDGYYGEPSWETVYAMNAKDALTAACEQKFGEGSIVYKESSWGTSIDSINGISGNGISFRSEQASQWDDVYYYPVQYVMEDGEWMQSPVAIPNYEGDSTTFAVVIEPLTFDSVEHTFADDSDQIIYDFMMEVYAWPGYGAPEYFITAEGEEFSVDGIIYTIQDFGDAYTVKVTGLKEGVTSVVVEEQVDYRGYTFDVQSIEFAAFIGSDVESATINVDVEEYAFSKTPLKVLRLEGDINVERGAFSFCKNLANVYVDESVKSLGERAFYGCTFKDQNGEVIDATLNNLAGHKFLGSKANLQMYMPELYSIFNVDGVIYKITSVDVPKVAVKGVADGVEDLVVHDTVSYLGYDWDVVLIASKAFYGNDTLKSAVIMGVDEIGMKAFAGCGSLVDVGLADIVTIGDYAFANSAVKNVLCGASVIGASAFSGCTDLSLILFGENLSSVGKNAFYKNLFYVDGVKVDRTAANLAGKAFRGGDGVLNAM